MRPEFRLRRPGLPEARAPSRQALGAAEGAGEPAPGPPPSFACGEIAEWNGAEVTVEMVCASGNAVVRTPDGLRTAPVAELHRSERPADAAAT